MTDLILLADSPQLRSRLSEIRQAAKGAELELFGSEAELEGKIAHARIVAGDVPEDALGNARKLEWIHSFAAGVDHALYPALVSHRATFTCSKGNGAVPLAEHAMMLMLMLNRDAVQWVRDQDARQWRWRYHGELNGLTCAIIGLGYSGQDLALKAKAFHMRVLGIRRDPKPTPNVDEVHGPEGLHGVLAQADFVVVTAPLTHETRGMLGEAEFRMMKPTAYYVCFSRGGIADDRALLKALTERWIAGAGLDAHGEEPLPPESPFWTTPNVIVTPHNGASTEGTRQRGIDIFVGNLGRFYAGRKLTHVVDKQLGY